MEMPPDNLEAVGVNDLLVAVTVDESFTAEQVYSVLAPSFVTTIFVSAGCSFHLIICHLLVRCFFPGAAVFAPLAFFLNLSSFSVKYNLF